MRTAAAAAASGHGLTVGVANIVVQVEGRLDHVAILVPAPRAQDVVALEGDVVGGEVERHGELAVWVWWGRCCERG